MATTPTIETGWYGVNYVEGKYVPATPCENRHCLAMFDAEDTGADYVGYWNGTYWEDIEAVD